MKKASRPAKLPQVEAPAISTSPESVEPLTAFPIVGVGASAGGLEAFTLLLEHLPPHTGMAFVLVQHLDPTHESQLREILSRKTEMPLLEVPGDTLVQPDHVYVIPPGKNLIIAAGILKTSPRPDSSAPNMPIDGFFQALAKDRQNAAFGIILSGTASDGSLGVKAIKAEGGITFAEDPASAKFDGMPRSAIASGAIDFVLPPEGIARQLVELSRHSYPHSEPGTVLDSKDGRHLDRIFVRLRAATGIDFTFYKHNTILRRIKRRMALQAVESLDEYSRRVEQNSTEAGALAQDFLVNVTAFFREPEVLKTMQENVFPALLEGRAPDSPVRIWIAGCSTGEEAYSVAMGLTEFLEERAVHPGIQIFATDLSDPVIEKARAGLYLEGALSGISPQRLERFFIKKGKEYQVSQAIRDLCVFARQDVTKDPPFSKMDLISCCNLLIYLGPVLQRRALSLFHYALKPKGFLVLGSSESVGTLSESFEIVDRKHKIFSKKGDSVRPNAELLAKSKEVGLTATARDSSERPRPANSVQKEAERMLLVEYAPPSVIIDEAMHVLQVRGHTDPYLQVPQGAPTSNLTPMVKPGLLAGLKAALEQARKQNMPVCERGLRVKEKDRFRMVDVRVSPIRGFHGKDRCFLVLFEDSAEDKPSSQKQVKRRKSGADAKARDQNTDRLEKEVARLEHELTETRDYLQAIIETQEASAEELRSSNEEAQATNEELDTAMEELQASNEELNTVNDELRIRNAEQSRLNSDLRKLLENINVPLVMVGKDLRIRWFTAAMEPVLNLLPTDQGRAITDLRVTLIPDFVEMLVKALAGSEDKSVEFQRANGRWLSLRIVPFRDPGNAIEGAIATLIDIDDLKRARDFAEATVETVREPLIVLDADLRVKKANDAFYKIFQLEKQGTEGRYLYEIGAGEWNIPRLRQLLEEILPNESSLTNFQVERTYPRIGTKTMLLNGREICQHDGERMILLAIDDITEVRRAAEDLRRTNEDLKQFIFAASHDLQEPLRMVVAHTQLLANRYADPLDSKAGVSIRYAVEGALRMEALISGLREFWQLSERDQQQRTLIDFNDALRQAMLNLETSIAENHAVITSGPLPSIMGAEAPFIQLLQNLLANALKYRTPEPPEIHVSAVREGAEWIFSVRDNGIGIDPRHAVQIFGVFKRLHAPDKYSGTGIGLAICQKIVERYGGRIWVESELGRGSEFKFAIPS